MLTFTLHFIHTIYHFYHYVYKWKRVILQKRFVYREERRSSRKNYTTGKKYVFIFFNITQLNYSSQSQQTTIIMKTNMVHIIIITCKVSKSREEDNIFLVLCKKYIISFLSFRCDAYTKLNARLESGE